MNTNETVLSLEDKDISAYIINYVYNRPEYRKDSIIKHYTYYWFDSKSHHVIMDILVGHIKKYQSVPTRTIFEQLIERYLTSKQEKGVPTPSVVQVKSDLNIILDKFNNQSKAVDDIVIKHIKAKSMLQCLSASLDGAMSLEDVVVGKMNELASITLDDEQAPLSLFSHDTIDKFIDMKSKKISTLSTGYKTLDTILDGGIRLNVGEVHVVGAGTGVGKSLFCSNLANNFAHQGRKVLVFSLEMDSIEWIERMYAHNVGYHCGVGNRANAELYAKQLTDVTEDIDKDSVRVYRLHSMNTTPSDIDTIITKNINEDGWTPDVVIIDYIGLMKSDTRYYGNGEHLRLSNIANEITNVAAKHLIPIITPYQLNRGAVTKSIKDINLSDIAGSYALVSHVDTLVMLVKDTDGNIEEDTNTFNATTIHLKLLKGRRKVSDIDTMSFIRHTKSGKFVDLIDAQNDEEATGHTLLMDYILPESDDFVLDVTTI